MVDAVSDRIDEVLAEIVGGGPVVLHQVIAGLAPVLIVAMQLDEPGQAQRVGAQPGIDRLEVGAGDPAIGHRAGRRDALQDQGIQGVRRASPAVDVRCRGVAGKAGVDLDGVHDAIQSGACAGCVRQEVVEPVGHVAHCGIGVAVLVAEAAIDDLEADVVDAVGHRVDQVLSEELGCGAVVLHQVVAGLRAVLIITMQFDESGQSRGVGADPRIDGNHIGGGNLSVAQSTDGCQTVHDQLVEAVGCVGSTADIRFGGFHRQAGVGHDEVGDAVQTAARAGMVGIELGQPCGHLIHRRVGIAVFIEESVVPDFETQVVDAIGDCVEKGLASVLQVASVVLDQVKSRLFAALVVPVKTRPFSESVLADPGVHRDDFGRREEAVGSCAGGGGRLQDDLVQPVRRPRTTQQFGRHVGTGQTGVGEDGVDELVESGPRGAGHRRGEHGITAGLVA